MNLQPSTDLNRVFFPFAHQLCACVPADPGQDTAQRTGGEPAQALRLNSEQMPGVPKNSLVWAPPVNSSAPWFLGGETALSSLLEMIGFYKEEFLFPCVEAESQILLQSCVLQRGRYRPLLFLLSTR